MSPKDHGDFIEDALVAWWHARTMLDAAQSRLLPGTDSIEHTRAARTETTARNTLYGTIEAYLSMAATAPKRLRRINPFEIAGYAAQLAEPQAPPPEPPARSAK